MQLKVQLEGQLFNLVSNTYKQLRLTLIDRTHNLFKFYTIDIMNHSKK